MWKLGYDVKPEVLRELKIKLAIECGNLSAIGQHPSPEEAMEIWNGLFKKETGQDFRLAGMGHRAGGRRSLKKA